MLLRATLDSLDRLWPRFVSTIARRRDRRLTDADWMQGREHRVRVEGAAKSTLARLTDLERRDHIVLGTGDQLLEFRARFSAWIAADWRPGDERHVRRQRGPLRDVYAEFFSLGRGDPGFVWVQNVWMMTAAALWLHGMTPGHVGLPLTTHDPRGFVPMRARPQWRPLAIPLSNRFPTVAEPRTGDRLVEFSHQQVVADESGLRTRVGFHRQIVAVREEVHRSAVESGRGRLVFSERPASWQEVRRDGAASSPPPDDVGLSVVPGVVLGLAPGPDLVVTTRFVLDPVAGTTKALGIDTSSFAALLLQRPALRDLLEEHLDTRHA